MMQNGRSSDPRSQRLTSLDALRGLIMVVLAGGTFGLHQAAEGFGDRGLWPAVEWHTSHAEWITNWQYVFVPFWDLIQPLFMFMVGVSLPFSVAARRRRGDSDRTIAWHAARRSLVLVMLGVFLASGRGSQTRFEFTNVLAQIGLGYLALHWVSKFAPRIQTGMAVGILAASWLFFAVDIGGSDLQPPAGSRLASEQIAQAGASWAKNTNSATVLDRWVLNVFPRPDGEKYEFNGGGYHTLNFFPALATMIVGLLAGQLLRSGRKDQDKLLLLLGAGAVCLVVGLIMAAAGCPIVKRIWTPSWVLFSGAWVLWILAAFYALFDVLPFRRYAFPLVIVGMNPLVMYMMGQLLRSWLVGRVTTHGGWIIKGILPAGVTSSSALNWVPVLQYSAAFAIMWLICYGMYRRRLFVRI
jgi:predicted acyltransferase